MAIIDVCQPTLDAGVAGLAGAGSGAGVTARTGFATDHVLSRRFRVEQVVGVGAMGVVVAAHHLALDVRVALKLMRPELRDHPRFVGRFLREARAAARLTSRHAVRMLDVGTLDDGVPYLVMEYLEGVDLATQLRARGPVAIARAVAIVVEVCHAVGEAHGLGIIHRDLKPANLFVTRGPGGEPAIKVLDLGVCRFTAEADELGETSSAAVVGTPMYMAPEQLRSARAADARSDIWSLGVILYELVTGHVPFRGHGVADQCARTMLDPVPAFDGADVPPAFAAVVARCLAKDPAARFQTMAELSAALQPLRSPRAVPAPRRSPRTIAVAAAILAATVAGSSEPRRAPAPRPDVVAPAHAQAMIPTSAVTCAAPPPPSSELARLEPRPQPPARAASAHARRAKPAPAAAFDPLATAN